MAQVLTPPQAGELGLDGAEISGELSKAAAAGVRTAQGTSAPSGETQAERQRRELIRVLSKGQSLALLIADGQQFDLRQACRVTKIALEEDADFDKKLVALVKSGTASVPEQIVRILTVLESVCPAPRLLGHILDLKHMEGRVRSKLTLMIGRLTRDPKWLRQQLEDENPRIRANAIEGLWDVRAEGLEELLRAAQSDPNHRVAANAALALHKVGDITAIGTLCKALHSPHEMFRRASLWAIGQSRDPRFLEQVERLAQNSTGEELSLAQRVREQLRVSLASSEFTAVLSLEVTEDKVTGSGSRQVRMCCVAESVGGWLGQLDLSALNFVITEGEHQLEDYRLQWASSEEPFVALIVQPRAWNGSGELLKPALRGAGMHEVYGFLPYQTPFSPVRGKEQDDAAEVKFENYLEMSKEYLGRRYEIARSLGFAVKLGLSALQNQKGNRHLFILADPSMGDAGSLGEVVGEDYRNVHIHAVVWESAKPELAAELKSLARKSKGHFVQASSAMEFARTLMSVRAAHFGAFELSWQSPAGGARESARIVCHSDYGFGEVLLR